MMYKKDKKQKTIYLFIFRLWKKQKKSPPILSFPLMGERDKVENDFRIPLNPPW